MKALLSAISAVTILSTLGCSPAADPIAKGSMSFVLGFVTDGSGRTCANTDQGGIGAPPPALPVTQGDISNIGDTRTDGEAVGDTTGTYDISCTVTKGGRISIEMSGLNDVAGSTLTGLKLSGNIDPSDGTGTGDVSVRTVDAGSNSNISVCNFQALESGDGFAIEEGKAQFTFECATMESALDDFAVCSSRGSVIVYDCLTE